MGAQQTLQTNIVINAKTGNGFSKLGNTLTEMGSLVNGFSQQLISLGEDSVEVYRSYEKSLKSAEVALSTTYGRGTAELAKVMKQLDASATDWAATTIFHTNDVGNAISMAAHAGWDLDEILSGLPAAMQLAQAGGLDLSEAVNYIVKSTSAAGIAFEDLNDFTDLWTYAANRSASDIREFGDAMLRMGGTMRFAGDTEELMTLIAVTANAGAVGAEAGTMIRNSMLRLLAPTEKAEKAMAMLGAASQETVGLLQDEELAAANAILERQGFSAYDEAGNLKNILQVYRELYVALGEIAGGYDNIERNQDAIAILSAIFPTRTITEALNLLRGARDSYDGLYEDMKAGAAEGYGEYAAETMMDTLNGDIEIFNSKGERLKQVVGGQLKDQVEDFAGFAGEIVDSLAEMDPDAMSRLIKGLEVIAGAGPALLVAGGAFRLIGGMLTPAGLITTGVLDLAAGAAVLQDLEDSKFADNFGNMHLDTEEILDYVNGIGEGLRGAYQEFDEFKRAVDEAAKAYDTASSSLSSKLLTDMLTKKELTQEDKDALYRLADDMYTALTDGIQNRSSASISYWTTLFGDAEDLENDPAFQQILDITNQSMEEATGQAEILSRQLRRALTIAFADGEVSDEEYQNIMDVVRSINDAMAQAAADAQSEEDFVKMSMWKHKAQTASWDEVNGLAQSAASERDSILAEQEEAYLTERFRLEYRGADQSLLSALDERYSQQKMQTEAAYDDFFYTLWDSQISQSDQAENYAWLAGIASQYQNGVLQESTVLDMINDRMGKSAYAGANNIPTNRNTAHAQLGRMLGTWVTSMGGEKELEKRIDYYRESGNEAMAERLAQMYAMEQLVNGFNTVMTTERPEWDVLGMFSEFSTTGQNEHIANANYRTAAQQALGINDITYSVETALAAVEALRDTGADISQPFENIAYILNHPELGDLGIIGSMGTNYTGKALSTDAMREYSAMLERLQETYDFAKVLADYPSGLGSDMSMMRYDYAAYQLLYGEASSHASDYLLGVDWQGSIEGALSGAQALMDGADMTLPVGGDFRGLDAGIAARDGTTITVQVQEAGGGSGSHTGGGFTGRGGKFALGGRATEASIFGEGDVPEWAIPEEHSERTAGLLNAARAASGWSWYDLLSRFGGLNADAAHVPTTLVYSPTIHAENAEGLDRVLRADKRRMEKWMREQRMRNAAEVYA